MTDPTPPTWCCMTRRTGEDAMSSEHVEVLERLRGVLEHGKMGDKCLIAPDLVTAAIAALSAPQPPAEAQAVAHYCEHRHKCKWHADGAWPSFGTGEGREQAWKDAHAERCGGRILPLYAHPPPSSPVGVEIPSVVAYPTAAGGTSRRVDEWLERWLATCDYHEALVYEATIKFLRALAQQPAADGGFTAADMMDARQEGRKEAEARAERLAEALREIERLMPDQAGPAWIAKTIASAALRDHDQENSRE